ncbi:protein PTCD3 homolog, mitochondrial [Ischnura elegans]|uniref:protein PTCD3 homolog, mitochondrial n=1 Tax=Ischnura elegans TaxID=197161 RepID=UPI001ED8A77B|nr:protein PTCD3 homolog, mitochondrial [Ischnura elegans]
MHPLRGLGCFNWNKCRWDALATVARHYSSSGDTIVIPKRIHRGPTDILRALESTVQRDYTAAEYKFHDDPFLIPTSNSAKRTYAMSKEAGRKAALWIRKEHAQWFNTKLAEPPIKALTAKPAITEASEASEEILKDLIGDSLVSDAITVYEILEKNGQELSEETKQAFLELLCFNNCIDSPSEELVEERWFRQSFQGKQRPRKTWKDEGLAENIFKSLSSGPNAGKAHRALVRGMARFGQFERAWQLLREMVASGDSNLVPDTGCYNAIISGALSLREGGESRWQMVETLLREMASSGLKPNIGTMNAVLEVISATGFFPRSREIALQTLSEFHHLGIEPSLASYYYILTIFCRERGPKSRVLVDILNKLDGQVIEARDPKDTLFFLTAMEVCRYHLQDVELAHRVHNLLLEHSNYDFIGDSFKESAYYRNYFILMCTIEPLETFMEVYNKLVPNVYVPEPAVMEEVLKAVDLNGAYELLPQLWSDMIIFDHTSRDSLLTKMLDILARNPVTDSPSDSEESLCKKKALRESYMRIAWGIWEKIEGEAENVGLRSRNLMWTGAMLGDLLSVCVQCDEFEKAWKVLVHLGAEAKLTTSPDEEPATPNPISGVPSIKSLSLFIDACIKKGDASKGLSCVKYAADAGFPESGELGCKLAKSLQLTPLQMNLLKSTIGIVNLETPLEKKDVAG